MTSDAIIVRCPRCGARNRVPARRWAEKAVCGKCKTSMDLSHLFPDHPIEVSDATYAREVLNFPGPVLAEFYSPG